MGKQLKSFLGTVKYLRDFVNNHTIIVKPLHDLIANYDKIRRIVWTPETTAAFHEMKLQVSECSAMHFMSDTAPITLRKDASDYGVRGYLFQTVDCIDQPIAFVSKSLNKSQLCWSVIQKEAYGISHSCMYSQSLLRDRLLKIRTYHRNLLFIKEASNPMIVQWYMALSEFSYTLELAPGVENNIADTMSRLCRNNMVTLHKNILKNTYSQQFLHQPNQTKVRLQRLAGCTIQKLAERTLKRFKDRKDDWQFQRQHIRHFIDECACCQKLSMLKIPIHAHRFTTST